MQNITTRLVLKAPMIKQKALNLVFGTVKMVFRTASLVFGTPKVVQKAPNLVLIAPNLVFFAPSLQLRTVCLVLFAPSCLIFKEVISFDILSFQFTFESIVNLIQFLHAEKFCGDDKSRSAKRDRNKGFDELYQEGFRTKIICQKIITHETNRRH